MQWLKRVLPSCLVIAAIAVVIVTMLSDHSSVRGSVPLPQGGTVTLPAGKTTVFADQSVANKDDETRLQSPVSFGVAPVGGGEPLEVVPSSDDENPDQIYHRSESIGSRGALASIDAPEAGKYLVAGSFEDPHVTGTLSFGTTSFAAVLGKWKLLAGLIGAAILISMMPLPRRSSDWDEAVAGSPSGEHPARPRFDPYNG
jgi:hypothetical protein